DHAIDGVNAAPADSDDLDDRQIVLRCCHEEGTFPLACYLALTVALTVLARAARLAAALLATA
ncbi:MAG: hypothetical protein ACRDOI_39620, partial [Trebonia sp.]